jgi:ATP-dependent helicase/nuclease subunit A
VKLKADLRGATCDLVPSEYRELVEHEKLMGQCEDRRLLYVAMTRARDRLIVSCFGQLKKADGEPSSALLAPLNHRLPAPGSVDERGEHAGVLVLMPQDPPVWSAPGTAGDVGSLLGERDAWMRERAELLTRARRPAAATSPSRLEQVDDAVRSGGPGAPPGRAGALALGSAVHRVMELCDLGDETGLRRLAGEVAAEIGRPDIAARTAELATACWRSAPARAASAAADVHRELPVGALIEGTILSGAIDLLYRDGEEWVVVDYKTDRADDPEVLRGRYEPQGAAYALAVEAATGGTVREVVFVAAAAGLEVVVPVTDALRERARAAVVAAGAGGLALAEDGLTAQA